MAETEGQVSVVPDKVRPTERCGGTTQTEFDSLYLTVTIAGMPVRCLIDSGSTMSVLHTSCYESIPLRVRPKLQPLSGSLRVADGGLVPLLGKAVFTLDLGMNSVEHSLVVADIGAPAILGMDFLKVHRCVLDASQATVLVEGHHYECHCSKDIESVFRVTVSETVLDRLRSRVILPGRVGAIPGHTTAVLQPGQQLIMQHGCEDPTGAAVPLQVVNSSQGDGIGECTSIQEVILLEGAQCRLSCQLQKV